MLCTIRDQTPSNMCYNVKYSVKISFKFVCILFEIFFRLYIQCTCFANIILYVVILVKVIDFFYL